MEWVERMNQAIDYIENHLCDDIDYEELSRIAACPAGLFQRMFIHTTDVSLSEYIRRRKLTCAAYDIQNTTSKMIDISMKYGYESSDAFCVAFKRMHGVTPTMARQTVTKLKSYMRLSFTLSIKGDVEMNYQVVEKGPFKVAGKIVTSSLENNITPQFWDTCKHDGTVEKLIEIGVEPHTLGVCFGFNEQGVNDYMVGIETLLDHVDGMEMRSFPRSKWLVFEAIGPIPHALSDTWKRIYGEFLPQSVYRQSDLPTLEVYFGDETYADDYKVEVWIPIQS
ncbi:AraC family transcriptional regulator [Gorillibacterium massiliense]|uniref:AraC family transcriptional regulator n=1 Tax=Gorillibacterium massiliense TaxID=1280390 RepID=UPI0004B3106B|nr:AraC family transcriptional regulator [Gorillibacterium massiliense]